MEAFAALPEVSPVTISPDGRYLAFIGANQNSRSLLIVDLQTGKQRPLLTDRPGGIELSECVWGDNKHVVCSEERLHRSQRALARKNSIYWRSDATRLWWAEVEPTAEGKHRLGTLDAPGDFPDQIVGRSAGGVLLTIRDRREGRASLYEFVLTDRTPYVRSVVRKTHPVSFYFGTGADGSYVGLGIPRIGPRRIFELSSTGESIRERTQEWTSPDLIRLPIGFNSDGTRIYAFEERADTTNVWSLDPAGKATPVVIASDPLFADAEWLSAEPRRFFGAILRPERLKVLYFDDRYSKAAAAIEKALPAGRFNAIIGSSTDAQKMVVSSHSDTRPDEYFLYDAGKATLTPIAGTYPQLESVALGSTQSVRIPARDGAQIPALLTTPPGAVAPKKSPMIVMPAGILGRRIWGFAWLEQFLATRGYALLEVNNRGSYGLDLEWTEAAKGDAADAPYRDVVDSVNWAIARGVADAERICLYGSSYGSSGFEGNLALLAAMRSPDLFKAVASFGAISDMGEYVAKGNNYPHHLDLREFIGGRSQIAELSPIRRVENAPPTLLVHARMDRQTRLTHSIRLDDALERAGRDHQLIVLDGATEDLSRPSDRRLLLKALEKFFGRHCQ